METEKLFSSYPEFEAWIINNKEKVSLYMANNDVPLGNIMSARAYNVMRINKISNMSDIIFTTCDELSQIELIDDKVLAEVLMLRKDYLKEHKNSIIDYIYSGEKKEKFKQTDTQFDVREFLRDETIKEKVEEFIRIHSINIEILNLSNRSYNALKQNMVNYLHEMIAYYPDGFYELKNIGVKSVNELSDVIEIYVKHEYNNIYHYITTGETQLETGSEYETKIRSFYDISDDLLDGNMPIEELGLSVRSYNVMKQNGINFLHEMTGLYPDGFKNLRNLGQKSIEELYTIIEKYLGVNEQIVTDNDFLEETDPYNLSIKQLLIHPTFKEKAEKFLKTNEISVEQMMLSNRSVAALKSAGYNTFLDVLKIYPNDISSLKSIGAKSVDDIKERTEHFISKLQNAVSIYCSGDESAMYSDEFVYDTIIACFEGVGYKGLSFKEIRTGFPEQFDDDRIKKCIGGMLADKKLEYVDFRLYKVYPSIIDAIKSAEIDPDDKNIVLEKLNGLTLDEIGKQRGVTRERIRQKYSKTMSKIKNMALNKYGSELFDEDYYVYLYSSYEVIKELWLDYLGVSEKTFEYLVNTQTKGNKPLVEALSDSEIDLILKFKIRDYLNRNKILIDGKLIERQRLDIEDYALSQIARDEVSFDKFVEKYNELLRSNGIDFDEKIYYTDEVRRTRGNRLSESKLCLWKQGEKLRYYDIVGQDYTELLETINLSQFSNTEISTLKFLEDFPDLMRKYDIRDQYELHNLLKKIIDVKDYNDMYFGRQPNINFGKFDRDQAMYDILEAVSPVTTEDLVEYIHMEYGYDRATTAASYLKSLNQYYHKGVYSIDFKKIPDDRIEFFKEALTEEFYYISEIKKFYKELFEGADIEDINPLSLKSLGFTVLGTYAIQNFTTAEAYFTHVLTKDDVYDISVYNKKFANIKSYYCVSRDLRMNYDILLFEPDRAITINRLNKLGISKEDIKVFCDEVEAFADSDSYFTIHSLRVDGFTSKLDNLGFDDYFYAMLLAADPRYLWQRVFGEIVLSIKSRSFEKNISTKSFLLSVLSEYDSVDIDDFIDDCTEKYGVRIPERYEVMEAISNTDFYYDRIMDKLYKNKSVYYEEFDD